MGYTTIIMKSSVVHQKESATHPFDISDDPEDRSIFLNDDFDGRSFAEYLLKDLEASKKTLKKRPVFLGLGVGAARAEVGFARKVGAVTIDLVDRNNSGNLITKQNNSGRSERIRFIQKGIFTYLSQVANSGKKYDVVTLIGVEYLTTTKYSFQQLLLAFFSALNFGGAVYITPTYSLSYLKNFDFLEFGFRNVSQRESYLVLVKAKRKIPHQK